MWMTEMLEETIGIVDHFHFAVPINPNDVTSGYSPNGFRGQVDVLRHEGKANYLHLDGHVQSIKWPLLLPVLTRSGSRFVMPTGRP